MCNFEMHIPFTEKLQARILLSGIETGTGFFHTGEVAVADNFGVGIVGLQAAEQMP